MNTFGVVYDAKTYEVLHKLTKEGEDFYKEMKARIFNRHTENDTAIYNIANEDVVDKVKNILSNKEGKVILTNFSYLFLLQIAGYLFPLLTMPYLARVIGADGFGRIAIASAVIMWIQTISDWGFNYTATRDVAKNRDDKDKVSHILSNVIWAKFILLFLSFIILKPI